MIIYSILFVVCLPLMMFVFPETNKENK